VFFRLGADHNVLRGDKHLYKQLFLRRFKATCASLSADENPAPGRHNQQ